MNICGKQGSVDRDAIRAMTRRKRRKRMREAVARLGEKLKDGRVAHGASGLLLGPGGGCGTCPAGPSSPSPTPRARVPRYARPDPAPTNAPRRDAQQHAPRLDRKKW